MVSEASAGPRALVEVEEAEDPLTELLGETFPLGPDPVVAAWATASLWQGLCLVAIDETLKFQGTQRRVDGALVEDDDTVATRTNTLDEFEPIAIAGR